MQRRSCGERSRHTRTTTPSPGGSKMTRGASDRSWHEVPALARRWGVILGSSKRRAVAWESCAGAETDMRLPWLPLPRYPDPMPPTTPDEALARLLLSLFNGDELRRFLRYGPDGDVIDRALPGLGLAGQGGGVDGGREGDSGGRHPQVAARAWTAGPAVEGGLARWRRGDQPPLLFGPGLIGPGPRPPQPSTRRSPHAHSSRRRRPPRHVPTRRKPSSPRRRPVWCGRAGTRPATE